MLAPWGISQVVSASQHTEQDGLTNLDTPVLLAGVLVFTGTLVSKPKKPAQSKPYPCHKSDQAY